MNWATAIVLIVLISAIAGVMRSRYGDDGSSRRQRRLDRRNGINRAQELAGPTAREKALEHEVVELRERIQVLEAIATDPARRTAEEIEKLRDER